jgi:hypothetical protein
VLVLGPAKARAHARVPALPAFGDLAGDLQLHQGRLEPASAIGALVPLGRAVAAQGGHLEANGKVFVSDAVVVGPLIVLDDRQQERSVGACGDLGIDD